MATSKIVDDAVSLFFLSLEGKSAYGGTDERPKFDSVEEIIEHWLHFGEAVWDCAEDFQIFLSAVALIFAWWQHDRFVAPQDESRLKDKFIPWRITRALKDKTGQTVTTDIFDPYAFAFHLSTKRANQLANHFRNIRPS